MSPPSVDGATRDLPQSVVNIGTLVTDKQAESGSSRIRGQLFEADRGLWGESQKCVARTLSARARQLTPKADEETKW